MATPSERDREREAQETDREMEILNREGGGATEGAPLRRLAYVAVAVIVALVVWRFFL
jgi:hypothetical protein